MNPDEMAKHGIRATVYSLEDSEIKVEDRGAGAWAVTNGGHSCLNTDLEWEYEPLPSSRTQEFFERCRYGLPAALQIAVEARRRGL
jgi:hypothetical protein